ncbi:fibrinogen alpha chain isoform X2 [Melanotaenia boesemani]|uniref:fibrinogen alpha chain isoform X2 n=1 Tax=Melanotaenia boesemani TaxID=1250792 RepID=UPI001C04CFB4|nr:fibrinogen alpha chain isoform X2 [Melanotaenia boesemani]
MQQCSAKSHIPLCLDDDWVSKCPSGCRLQGLISQMESDVERKVWTICKMAKMYEDVAEKAMSVMTHIYNSNRRVIVNRYMSEVKFVEHAEGLARNLTALRKRSASLEQKIKELSSNVKKQIEKLYRAEVEIDMKLRNCRGSCRSVLPFSVDHQSYQMLQDDMDFMEKAHKQKSRIDPPPTDIPQIKLQTVNVGLKPSAEYKTIPTVQRELLTQFEDIGLNQLVLDELKEESADMNALNVEIELE